MKTAENKVSKRTQSGARNQQVARAGEYFVAAEMNKRGAFAVTFSGNMPKIDLMACDQNQSRTVHIQVKTKRGGKTWQTSIKGSQQMTPREDETVFWLFVDLGEMDNSPRYWIVPNWWALDDIYQHHKAYLDRHHGKRVRTQESTHHSIDEGRLQAWKDRWDILGIFV